MIDKDDTVCGVGYSRRQWS